MTCDVRRVTCDVSHVMFDFRFVQIARDVRLFFCQTWAFGGCVEDVHPGLGFRVWGLGFRVWGLWFRVWGLGFEVLDFEFLD